MLLGSEEGEEGEATDFRISVFTTVRVDVVVFEHISVGIIF